jgi:hypothetical protein
VRTPGPSVEDNPQGFRRARVIVGLALAVLFVVAYVIVAASYRADVDQRFTAPAPPVDGVALVFAPSQMSADQRTVSGEMLLFVGPQLTFADGELTQRLEIELYPTLSQGALVYAVGKQPSPVTVTLPAAGIVQRYPFDQYAVALSVRAVVVDAEGETTPVASQVSLFFQMPGWTYEPSTTIGAGAGSARSRAAGTIMRSFSTKLIALLLLVLMVVLAVIAVIVVQRGASGAMPLELSVASWLTAMLFALLPIRGFLPGNPPVGSWIDILVFFWVEGTIMVCVALTVTGLLVRGRRER